MGHYDALGPVTRKAVEQMNEAMTIEVGDWVRWKHTPDYTSFNRWHESIAQVRRIKKLKRGISYLVGDHLWQLTDDDILEVRKPAKVSP